MTITATGLTKAAGIAAATAGAIFIGVQINHPPMDTFLTDTDEWAQRNLTICVRNLADLPIHAQELVRSLAGPAEPQRSVTHA